MEKQIPVVVDELYRYFVTPPDPRFWPDYLRSEPILAHGLWSFYQGLRLGIRVSQACSDAQ
ncbi:MAG: hypothetical protein J6A62_02570 [Oscillospiraceae bacterium]|nr:hypothetical protein [Oscillospiraceae bacterium]